MNEKDTEYENNNIAYSFQLPEEVGGGIKCKNYELCEELLPKWWFECKGNYLCSNCHMMFGTWDESHTGKGILEISDDLECPICLENKRGISQPNCEHTSCIDCFKRCYYGNDDTENEPIFPYPDNIEDEYYKEQDNPKWETDFPLIKIHNEEWNKWEDEKSHIYSNEENLRTCPLCRK
jgi:hypothetical protein